jgi:hypothetical protein
MLAIAAALQRTNQTPNELMEILQTSDNMAHAQITGWQHELPISSFNHNISTSHCIDISALLDYY